MATPMEVRQKHRAVMKFLGAEGETPANIHKRLQNVYKGDSLEYINVWRWACRLNDEIKFGSGKKRICSSNASCYRYQTYDTFSLL